VTGPLAGRVGVVTGASAGIGAALARVLAGAGMTVVLGARREDRLATLVDEIARAGGRADGLPTDVRDETQVTRLVDAAVERHGRLDALVNNAAVGALGTIAEGRTDDWRAMVDTNLLGPLFACRAALRHMLARGAGDIVNVSSASVRAGWPYLGVYAATKAGLETLSAALRAEVASAGIRVMTIEVHNVGPTEFGMRFDATQLPAALRRWTQLGLLNPEAPLVDPETVARAVLFQLTQPSPASVHHLVIRSRAN
jgi:NADP-dependent 3-hydroxy acid dehydrogenase YdfG